MRITFVMRKFGNVERNSHCDVLHITPISVARLFLDCNGDFAIKAYSRLCGTSMSQRASVVFWDYSVGAYCEIDNRQFDRS